MHWGLISSNGLPLTTSFRVIAVVEMTDLLVIEVPKGLTFISYGVWWNLDYPY